MSGKELIKAQRDVDKELPYAQAMIAELEGFQITNDDDQEFVAEGLREIKLRSKELEEKRKKITVPMNAALKEVNNLFRPVREALEKCEGILEKKITEYQLSLEQMSQDAVEAAAVAETSEEASEALEEIKEIKSPKGVSVRYVWEAEVFRPELVPYEFLSPDLVKIKEYVKSTSVGGSEPAPIAGVRYHKKPIVTSRAT